MMKAKAIYGNDIGTIDYAPNVVERYSEGFMAALDSEAVRHRQFKITERGVRGLQQKYDYEIKWRLKGNKTLTSGSQTTDSEYLSTTESRRAPEPPPFWLARATGSLIRR